MYLPVNVRMRAATASIAFFYIYTSVRIYYYIHRREYLPSLVRLKHIYYDNYYYANYYSNIHYKT